MAEPHYRSTELLSPLLSFSPSISLY
uniref:Uncharacterized protein n=1 Tax=Arundo donax TaxID=35708 RepID=A0A0A8YAQ9_ARUDO